MREDFNYERGLQRAMVSSDTHHKSELRGKPKGRPEEEIQPAGQLVFFYPKSHCELNFIRRFWSAARSYARLRQVLLPSTSTHSCLTGFPSVCRRKLYILRNTLPSPRQPNNNRQLNNNIHATYSRVHNLTISITTTNAPTT